MITQIQDALAKFSSIAGALTAIEQVAKNVGINLHGADAVTGDAVEAVKIIQAIIDTVRAGFENKLTKEAVDAEIASLLKTVLGVDAAEDQALSNKFATGGTLPG